MDCLSIGIFVIFLIGCVSCGEYCYDNGRTFYCDYGCCGDYADEYCCGVYTWIVVVAVIGAIALVSFIVIVYCVWKKHNMRKGRVINTTPQTQTTTFITAPIQPPAYQHHPPAYNNQPSAYNNQPSAFNNQPSAFNNQPSAYNNQPSAFNNQPLGFDNQNTGVYPPPPPANYAADPAYPPVN